MNVHWTPLAWEDYVSWQSIDDSVIEKINELIRDIRRHPFQGIGKPEPLRGNLAGWWSRRITGDHRLVYRVQGKDREQRLEIIQCRYHY